MLNNMEIWMDDVGQVDVDGCVWADDGDERNATYIPQEYLDSTIKETVNKYTEDIRSKVLQLREYLMSDPHVAKAMLEYIRAEREGLGVECELPCRLKAALRSLETSMI